MECSAKDEANIIYHQPDYSLSRFQLGRLFHCSMMRALVNKHIINIILHVPILYKNYVSTVVVTIVTAVTVANFTVATVTVVTVTMVTAVMVTVVMVVTVMVVTVMVVTVVMVMVVTVTVMVVMVVHKLTYHQNCHQAAYFTVPAVLPRYSKQQSCIFQKRMVGRTLSIQVYTKCCTRYHVHCVA